MEKHPEAFEEAKDYEKQALENQSPFTWTLKESLEELSQPERVEEIKIEYLERLEKSKSKKVINPLRPNEEPVDIDELYGQSKVCLACHK
jgi:hypothetical protein